jgi:hypothetical protein
MVDATSLVGPEGWVAERLAAFKAAGVTTLMLTFPQGTHEDRVRTVEQIKKLVSDL